MEEWEDTGIVLSARPHGDNGAIVSLLTTEHGRYSGYVYGGQSSKNRGLVQLGNVVYVHWKSRLQDSLGQYKLELESSSTAGILDNRISLQTLQSACAIADKTLPEREPCLAVAEGMKAFIITLNLDDDIYLPSYIYWELGLLRELGFGLDLSCCALTGETENLAYVSPKTGRAASLSAGEKYKDKLLSLPSFLCGSKEWTNTDILNGLKLTGYFLQNRVFAQTHTDMPKTRYMLQELIKKTISSCP